VLVLLGARKFPCKCCPATQPGDTGHYTPYTMYQEGCRTPPPLCLVVCTQLSIYSCDSGINLVVYTNEFSMVTHLVVEYSTSAVIG